MPKYDYNIAVIGAGSAGLVSAYIAAAVKAKVALIEKHKMGGDCLNTGCVPSKALIRSAQMLSYAKRATEFGFKSHQIDFTFSDIMARVHKSIQAIEPHDSIERYQALGVDCYSASAKLLSPHQVSLGDQTLSAKSIIIATGARPLIPPIDGLDSTDYITSDTLWSLKECPKKLLILGGGPIGCEMAQAFSRLGSHVTIVDMSDRLLPREDSDVSSLIQKNFEAEGISVLTKHKAISFQQHSLLCEHKGSQVTINFDKVLIAVGRQANVSGFGLEELGITLQQQGRIQANPFLQTSIPNIYVCGDVTGPYQFTHTASHQAWYACVNALFSPFKSFKVDYRVIPHATFVDPEIARVGINEEEAKLQGIPYEVTTYGIDDLDRAIVDSEAKGFIKVLTVPKKDKILGVTIVGSHAGELIAEYVLAMKHGIGLNKILGTIHIYPTMAEANKYVAGQWKRKNAPQWALALLKKFHQWRR